MTIHCSDPQKVEMHQSIFLLRKKNPIVIAYLLTTITDSLIKEGFVDVFKLNLNKINQVGQLHQEKSKGLN